MELSLVERGENGRKIIDLSLPKEQVKLGSLWECKIFSHGAKNKRKILKRSNMLHIEQGQDSDVYNVRNKILKVFCQSGECRSGHPISFETLKKYQVLTADAKEFLENNPPEHFTKYKKNGRVFKVKYAVVPIEEVFCSIGPNLRDAIVDYFGCYTKGHRIRWVGEKDPVSASTQEFISGKNVYDVRKELFSKGLSKKDLKSFFKDL